MTRMLIAILILAFLANGFSCQSTQTPAQSSMQTSIQASSPTPIQSSVQSSGQSPIQTSIQASSPTPIQSSMQTSGQSSIQTSIQSSTRTSTLAPNGTVNCDEVNPCLNGAECKLRNQTTFVCKCQIGWEGVYCELEIDPCNKTYGVNPCKNGAQCIRVGFTDYRCDCTSCNSNYTGKHCDVLNYCRVNPCLNGGDCVNSNSSYICKCPRGFNGSRCENMTNLCSTNPCQNGGTCFKWGFYDYKCLCPANFTGKSCEFRDLCVGNKCLNGGKCVVRAASNTSNNATRVCTCPFWYIGSNCETLINYCQPNNPCRNGGTCQSCFDITTCSKNAYYKCNCASGYTGLTCDGYSSSTCLNKCTANNCKYRNGAYYCI